MNMLKRLLFIPVLLPGLFATLYACTGDCLTCHPKLLPTIQKDPRHKPMLGCIECHSADPNAMAECGSECFTCHPVEKVENIGVKEHEVIRGCRDCHVQIKEALSDIATPRDQSVMPPLKDLLVPPVDNNSGF